MDLFDKFKTAALVAALTIGINPAWAVATTFTTSGASPWIEQNDTDFGPTMILKENFAGALQTADGRPGVVAFDLLGTLSSYVPGKWVLSDTLGSEGTTATWCGKHIDAANLWLLQGTSNTDPGGRLYIRLPNISANAPCTLEVKPLLYAQKNSEPGQPINIALFDPSDPLGIAKQVAANPFASQSDIDDWARPTVDPDTREPIRQLGQISNPEQWVSAIVSGDKHSFNLACQYQALLSAQGKVKSLYVAAILPGNSGFFFMDGNGGWHLYTGQGDWQAYTTETMRSEPYNIVVAQNLDVTGLPDNTAIYVGWGSNSSEVANEGQFSPCYVIQGN